MSDNIDMEQKMAELADQAQEAAKIMAMTDMAMVASEKEPLAIAVAHMASVAALIAAMASAADRDFKSAESLVDDLVEKFLKTKLREDLERGVKARVELEAMLKVKEAISKAKKAA